MVLLFTSVLTHAANVFELIPCVKPSASEFQINLYAQLMKVGPPDLFWEDHEKESQGKNLSCICKMYHVLFKNQS